MQFADFLNILCQQWMHPEQGFPPDKILQVVLSMLQGQVQLQHPTHAQFFKVQVTANENDQRRWEENLQKSPCIKHARNL